MEVWFVAVEKVTFTLPEELIRRLAKIPVGKRSLLVKNAVEQELDRQAALLMLQRIRGKPIWKESHHPELRSLRDFARYRPIKSRATG